jgi:hypothetical protein
MKEIKPKLLDIKFGNQSWNEFIQLQLIPSITILIDKQYNEDFLDTESIDCKDVPTLYKGYTAYNLIFEWLGFYFQIRLNKLTKKEA